MKRLVSPLVTLTLLSSCAHVDKEPVYPEMQRAIAQARGRQRPNYGGRYDGPPPNFKREQWERRPSTFGHCHKYANDTAKHVLMCNAGVEEGMQMASKYAFAHGREDGYLRGYAWGLNQSAYYYQNDPQEIARGEASVDTLNSYLSAAIIEGQRAGERDGDSLGSTEAKGQFYRAVNTKVIPAPNYVLPATNFHPTPDAYRSVSRVPTVEEILKRDRYGRMKFYDGHDRVYGGGPGWRERNGRDVWSKDGVYNHNQNDWIEGARAFDYWLDANPGARKKYSMLNERVSYNETDAERMPAQVREPREPRDPNGPREPRRPTEPGNPGPANTTPPVANPGTGTTPPPAVVVDYQAIFKDAFIQSYNAYAQYEYSRAYYSFIDNGQREGEDDGAEIGVEIAYYKGLERAYNQKYAVTSQSNYRNSFAMTFGKSYKETYDYYRNNAILSLSFIGVKGLDDDGIIQPGEDLSATFKVTNVGGVASSLKYTLAGDIQSSVTLNDSIEPISTKTIQSPKIGEVLNTLDNGASASYTLDVNGMKERQWQEVKRPLQFQNISSNLSPLDGTGVYSVTVANIATVPLNGAISLDLVVNGTVVKTVNAGTMTPGEKLTYSLDFSKLDPLVWINGKYNVEILLKYNNAVFVRNTSQLRVDDYALSLAQYFTRLVNEKGVVPEGKTLDVRVSEIKSLLLSGNSREVDSNVDSSGNVYRTNPESTFPGKILNAKTAFTANGTKANSEFTSLADGMSSESKKFKSFIGIAPKRSAYNEILSNIGGKKYK